ncbi:MAG: endo-1,4-beta-xylanase [Pirellulales bacterium]|nr:endo-1,4-beta-xylanase [Pirellulales bacterium]
MEAMEGIARPAGKDHPHALAVGGDPLGRQRQVDSWRFEWPDALVEWSVDNHVAIHGQTLVWHAQTNDWFFRNGDKAAVTRRMKNHIDTLIGCYRGKIQSWDVVNEMINDGGNAQTALLENFRNSSWLRTLGPEFLTLAFKFSHEADPDAKLYYNDSNNQKTPAYGASVDAVLHPNAAPTVP